MKRKIIIAVMLAIGTIALVVIVAYFSKCDLKGDALMNVCACGYCRVHMSGGIITLAEPNHDRKIGDIVGRYDATGKEVILNHGTNQIAIATVQDNLGLRYATPDPVRDHLVFMKKWKAYIHLGWIRITSWSCRRPSASADH